VATKTRRQRESGLKDARQGLTLLALLAAISAWHGTSSLSVGFIVFMLALVVTETGLIVSGIVRRRRLQAYDYTEVYAMNGEEFEEYLRALFSAKGYRATLTPNGSDFGADLIIEKNGEKTAVQAKHWVKRDVGVTAVQEVRAAQAFYHTSKAMVVSVGAFTKQAIDLAAACQVELWDGPRLQREVLALRGTDALIGKQALAPAPELLVAIAPPPSCPRCSSAMVQRQSKHGQFWGCSRYPGCRGTRTA
jgi:restriction system protein